MQLAGGVGEVLAGQGDAHEVRDAAGVAACDARDRARGEQARECILLRFQRAFLEAAPRAELADGGAGLARGGLLRPQLAIGGGNRHLRAAQRVARLAPVGFAALEVGLERIDARAQRGQVLFPCRSLRRQGSDQNCTQEDPVQALVFPCAATAAIRLAISAWSPR